MVVSYLNWVYSVQRRWAQAVLQRITAQFSCGWSFAIVSHHIDIGRWILALEFAT
jgi:hypothetical protein